MVSQNGQAIRPIEPVIYSFPSDYYQPDTAKVRIESTRTFTLPSGCCIGYTSLGPCPGQTPQTSNFCVFNGSAVEGLLTNPPWLDAATTATYESVRRTSLMLEVTYTGRADLCSGLLVISNRLPNSSGDTELEVDTAAEVVSAVNQLEGIRIPMSKLLQGPIRIVQRPINQSAENFTGGNSTNTFFNMIPIAVNGQYGWEPIIVGVTGADVSSTISVSCVETAEIIPGNFSSLGYFLTPHRPPPQRGSTSGLVSYQRAFAGLAGMAKPFVTMLADNVAGQVRDAFDLASGDFARVAMRRVLPLT